MEKFKEIFQKYRELITYLFFGVMTTAVSWIIYFTVMWGGRAVFDIPADSLYGDAGYIILYTAAQIISWVCAVLFAFYTNRRWVFVNAEKNVPVLRQLIVFSSGRLITLGLDYIINLGGMAIVTAVILPHVRDAESQSTVELVTMAFEVAVKLIAAVAVIIGNYIFSKLFVFKKSDGGENA